ncbi:TetR/AcrR family transcriptional regulator [Actinoplanes utahensis]|uniref:HTH tetR-type domain-containing protein n=1 Tax=Actinoplanes utahensis TaxID=1869 RepID=A0A0A6XDD1_ACTUT|nr:TetR/AcrR family transcriptional regulator [Actinoplanes utahensis]KHD78107.1 hypothetical protein MB27_06355 [Actinoplanes utahensis]GIF30566.1 TetR family transcriptional regulator [Actinoplanes utahensis]
MPKVVDPRQRRAAIADAVLAVVARHGLEAASLRNVADEAKLAIGSVRHYFDGHEELIIFAAQELNRRVIERVRSYAESIIATFDAGGGRAERRRLSEDLLAEWLPLDEARHREAVLRHTFAIAARTRPELRSPTRALRDSMAGIVHRVLSEARNAGGLAPEVEVDQETRRLCALLDGLALHAVTAAEPPAPDDLRRILRYHIETLT